MNASVLALTLVASPTVHVDVEAASTASARDLEEWIELRLVEEGFTTTDDSDAAEIRLRLVVREREVWIEAEAATLDRDRVDVEGDEVSRLEVLHRAIETLERAQATGELAAEVETASATARPAAAMPPSPPREAAFARSKREPAARPRARRDRLAPPRFSGAFAGPFTTRIGARAGLLARGGENVPVVDPLVGADLRLGRAPGLGARFDLQVWPTVTGPIRVVEVVPAAGPSLRIAAGRRLDVDVSLLVGALVHAWRLGAERDARIDASFELPLGLDIRLARGFAISIAPHVGVATRQRRHLIEDEVAWVRGSWRVGVALGLAWSKERAK